MAKFRVFVPFVNDMGSVSPFHVTETGSETRAQAALWHINSMRDHDGLAHLTRMPNGTRYERATEPAQHAVKARIVECAYLQASDFDGAPGNCVIVKTGRASNFRVERQALGVFIVYGRAEFVGGSKVVRGIEAVRRLLITR